MYFITLSFLVFSEFRVYIIDFDGAFRFIKEMLKRVKAYLLI